MLSNTVVNEKVPFIRSKSVLTICGNIWLDNAIKDIDTSDTKRYDRYKRIDPEHLGLEQPRIFKEDHFVSCLEDRLNGSLFIDKKINYLMFKDFLDKSTQMEGYDEIAPSSGIIKEISESGLDPEKYNLIDIFSDSSNLSKKSMYWLTKDVDNNWIILYDCVEDKFNFDDLVNMIFREYDFENITLNMYEEGDADYPTPDSVKNENKFDCGLVRLEDSILDGKSLEFKFYNLYLINTILEQK